MSLARPDKAFFYATVCTVTPWSRAGCSAHLNRRGAACSSVVRLLRLLRPRGDGRSVRRPTQCRWGGRIILLKGLTPIPYKIVTIASGFAGYNLPMFIALSVVARGGPFFLLAFLLHRYGPQARTSSKNGWGILGHYWRRSYL